MEKMSIATHLDWNFSDVNLFKRSLFESMKHSKEASSLHVANIDHTPYELGCSSFDSTNLKVSDAAYSKSTCPSWMIEQEITILFIRVGLRPQYTGFDYARRAILYNLECGSLQPVTTRIYPHIAKTEKVSNCSVERDIRHLLKVAYDNGKLFALNDIVGEGSVHRSQPMTNNDFIALISEYFFWQIKNVENRKIPHHIMQNT